MKQVDLFPSIPKMCFFLQIQLNIDKKVKESTFTLFHVPVVMLELRSEICFFTVSTIRELKPDGNYLPNMNLPDNTNGE